ncbi:MAG: hypothetical protein DSZ07_06970 [Sulfurovum sp.]|nr:MAG: hypothetical protein DSZ07_06970 [Sulfurovum sp.]
MEYLLDIGFLGTSAPYFMDIILVYLLSLPILMTFSILLVGNRKYGLHRFTQTLLFLLTVFVLFIFNYEIYIVVEKELFYLLLIELFFSIVILIMWLRVILFAVDDRRRKGLPGLYSSSHKKSGKRIFLVMLFMIFINTYLYWIVYVD